MSSKTSTAIAATSSDQDNKEPLSWMTMPNGLPCFVGNVKDVVKRAFAEGHQFFYVLGVHKERVQQQKKFGSGMEWVMGDPEVRLFYVVKSLLSESITLVNDNPSLEQFTPNCWFTLPKIPWSLISKMDTFFRRVYDKVKTESIVVLTYDTRRDDGSGWGIIVPDQTNSGGHCSYQPHTVLESIPDEDQEFIRLVGTAHSHPAMSAFASHTDHDDQINNDGIHITFGWPKNGPTAFHIEVQSGDVNWEFTEEAIFERMPETPVDETIDALADKVKVHTVSSSSTQWTGGYGYQWNDQGTRFSSSSYTPDKAGTYFGARVRALEFEGAIPNPTQNIILCDLYKNDLECPICNSKILKIDRERRWCADCHSFFVLEDEDVHETVDIVSRLPLGKSRLIENPDAYPYVRLERDYQNDGSCTLTTQALTKEELLHPKA